jgi:hypothetical protein
MKLSVHCAFDEGFVGLSWNSTKMKTISTQVFDEFTAHNLSGFARKSTMKKYLAPQDSPSKSRRPLTGGYRVHVDRCISRKVWMDITEYMFYHADITIEDCSQRSCLHPFTGPESGCGKRV